MVFRAESGAETQRSDTLKFDFMFTVVIRRRTRIVRRGRVSPSARVMGCPYLSMWMERMLGKNLACQKPYGALDNRISVFAPLLTKLLDGDA
ncbi:MAG: hypothetical protein Q4F71_08045 [Paracoccus sp. (in: a-proteobacteria)]|nr:hypothetical protein [Paracoccus sp. (in: a-proteobacteria)]